MSKVSFARPEAPADVAGDKASEGKVIDVKAEPVVESTVGYVDPNGAPKTEVVDVTPANAVPGSSQVPAVVPAASVPAVSAAPVQFDDENIGFDDVILPRLNIVQKVGELSNVFTPGEIVLNQTLPIYTPPVIQGGAIVKPGTDPLVITVLGFKKKQFVEKIAGGAQGAIVSTLEEVGKMNGTTDYREHSEKTKLQIPCRLFQPLATALVLVQKPKHIPDEDHIQFPYECEGNYYALVLFSAKGTGYTNFAKVLFTARKIGHLRPAPGYPAQNWTLATKLEKYGENYAHIPVAKPANKNNEVYLNFVKEVLGCGR